MLVQIPLHISHIRQVLNQGMMHVIRQTMIRLMGGVRLLIILTGGRGRRGGRGGGNGRHERGLDLATLGARFALIVHVV